jgi:hypothetical protein
VFPLPFSRLEFKVKDLRFRVSKDNLFLISCIWGGGGGGLIYGRYLVFVIIFIVPVKYIVNEKKYKHTVYNT